MHGDPTNWCFWRTTYIQSRGARNSISTSLTLELLNYWLETTHVKGCVWYGPTRDGKQGRRPQLWSSAELQDGGAASGCLAERQHPSALPQAPYHCYSDRHCLCTPTPHPHTRCLQLGQHPATGQSTQGQYRYRTGERKAATPAWSINRQPELFRGLNVQQLFWWRQSPVGGAGGRKGGHTAEDYRRRDEQGFSSEERCPTLAKLEGLVPRAHRLRRRHHQCSVPARGQINRRVRVTGRVQALSCRPFINCFCSGMFSAGSDITFVSLSFVCLGIFSMLVFYFLSFWCSIQ